MIYHIHFITAIVFFFSLIFNLIIVNNAYADTISTRNNHALLIGVSQYPSLPKNKQLKGPKNDVRLLKQVLLEKYSIPEKNITTLTSAQQNEFQPTYQTIVNNLEKLVKRVKTNDHVLLYFSGHGSQQPNPNESDQYDEIFLPSDIGKWSNKKQSIKNALVDNEIGYFIDKLLAKSVSVWLIMDNCHAATSARNSNEAQKTNVHSTRQSRYVSLAELGVPQALIQRIQKKKYASRGDDGVNIKIAEEKQTHLRKYGDARKTSAHFIGFYASAADEKAFEAQLAFFEDKTKKTFHGYFSYSIISTLQQTQQLSYLQLQQNIQQKLYTLGAYQQNPQYEGAKDLTVLTNEPIAHVNNWRLRLEKDVYFIKAGKLNGLAKGMHLKVVPTVMTNKSIANVKITAVRMGYSELCFINKQGNCLSTEDKRTKAKKSIKNRGGIVFVRLAEKAMIPTLAVYLSEKAQNNDEQLIKEKFAMLKQENHHDVRFIKWVETPQDAEIIINFPTELSEKYQDKSQPKQIWIQVPKNTLRRIRYIVPIQANNTEKAEIVFSSLIDKLHIINKSIRLKELIKETNNKKMQEYVDIKLFKKKIIAKEWQVIDSSKSVIKVPPEHNFGFTFQNNSENQYMDLGLFMLQPDYKILSFSCYDPDHKNRQPMTQSMRLAPKEKCEVNHIEKGNDFFFTVREQKNALGSFYLFIIAIEKELNESTEDYSYLLQPAIRGIRGIRDRTTSNKIENYLRYFSLQGGNRTRDTASSQLPDHVRVFMRLIKLDIK